MEEEFCHFVAARGASLCRTAYLLTGDWQAGEDLVQEALAKTYLRRRRLRDQSALEPYTRKVLMTLFLSSRRRQWSKELPFAELPDHAGAPAPASIDEFAERDGLWQALAELPAQQRAVLVLRYFEDRSEAEIAAALNCPPGTVKSHAARGLDRLRKTVAVTEGWPR
ncbi:MAG TPA: SigE family RNA polymerase sigma factor [Streptosporangiaceae bacterium]|nr:SigE family RNA polymerase sigma factor [Streptosporangiaceae bacterium]